MKGVRANTKEGTDNTKIEIGAIGEESFAYTYKIKTYSAIFCEITVISYEK